MIKFVIYPSGRWSRKGGRGLRRVEEWRWRAVAGNNRTLADSGEGYANADDAAHGIAMIIAAARFSYDAGLLVEMAPDTPTEVAEAVYDELRAVLRRHEQEQGPGA